MFQHLSERFADTLNRLRGKGRLTDQNIEESVAQVRRSLIEADVALSVVEDFVSTLREQSVGQKINAKINPGHAFIKLVQDKLVQILGSEQVELNLKANPPVVILMAGLQGSGKTTTTAKLAYFLKQKQKKVLLTSVDIYRPAALEQIRTLSQQINVDYFESVHKNDPILMATEALSHARTQFYDVLLVDTAGRLHIDETLMAELKAIHQAIAPQETLLVVDGMMGQDAALLAKKFDEQLAITGVILTKLDGDARGGAALSMRSLTGKPIKFLGLGEKTDALEVFYPDRIASRILGMGDIVSLVEAAQSKIDQQSAQTVSRKIKQGGRFDFNDFLKQIQGTQNLGGFAGIMAKLPGVKFPNKGLSGKGMLDDQFLIKIKAMIQSMTPRERTFPALLNGSRKQRIAKGSGTDIQAVNKMVKQFEQTQKLLKRFKGDKMKKQLKHFQNAFPGKMPFGDQLPEDFFK